MADGDRDEQLKAMAQHRGMKLVKSRKRTPGVGDYGHYGLTDAAGKALLGIGDDGLTASADDVETYLRNDSMGTWKQSADSTPSMPRPKRKPPAPPEKIVETRKAPKEKRLVAVETPPPPPEPTLVLRSAKTADVSALVPLINQLPSLNLDTEVEAINFATVSKAGGGILIAELDEIIGCCSWCVIPTLHRGPIGRLTILVVDKKHRRQGIGTKLLDQALDDMARVGCTVVEAISDIEIRNNHGFFRSHKFDQTSYRFLKPISPATS